MITLFIDSSRKNLSVALARSNELLSVSNVNSYSKHSNYLMKEIINILNNAKLMISDVDNVVVLNGPGSFTGVRVGVTIAKTLAWVLSKKLYQLTALEALAVGVKEEVIITVIPDKKDASYVGVYEGDKKFEDYLLINDGKLNFRDKRITISCMDENDFVINLKEKLALSNVISLKVLDDYDYLKVINYALTKESINPHIAAPVYLKKIDAEKQWWL